MAEKLGTAVDDGSHYESLHKNGSGEVASSPCSCIGSNDTPYTWKELQEIERTRRAILKRVGMPFWRILLYWDGTCLKVMVRDGLLWASVFLYILVRVQKVSGTLPHYLDELGGDTNIDIIGGFLSFFLVLFVNQANARFNAMYNQSMACTNRITDITAVVALYFSPAAASRVVRYLHAAHVAGYVGLAPETYSYHSFFVPLNTAHQFLTPAELSHIQPSLARRPFGTTDGCDRDGAYNTILAWVLREIQLQQGAGTIDARMAGELRTIVQGFRNAMRSLYDDQDQPIHFFYIHFLSLLTVFYLPIFAIATAYKVNSEDGEDGVSINWTAELLSGLIVFLQAIFVIGLRLLGQVMVDPYGDDYEDLSVLHYIRSTWIQTDRILKTRFPETSGGEEDSAAMVEKELEQQRTKEASSMVPPQQGAGTFA